MSEIESKVRQGNTTRFEEFKIFIASSSLLAAYYSISDKECIMDLAKPFMVINNF